MKKDYTIYMLSKPKLFVVSLEKNKLNQLKKKIEKTYPLQRLIIEEIKNGIKK